MPETRGRSLENIQEAFQHPAASSVSRYLRRLVPGLRRRAAASAAAAPPTGVEVELESRDLAVPLEATSASLEGAVRGLRIGVSSA